MPLIIFNAALAFAAAASEGQAWAYVPAARDSRSLWGFEVIAPPTEGVVTLVGADRLAAVRQSELRRVFAVEIRDPQDTCADAPPADGRTAPAVPAEAHWPDAHGRIAAGPAAQGGAPAIPGVRNPWEVRDVAKSAVKEIVFACGGIVVGGEGGAVAILNGRIVKQGDSVDGFSVAGVLATGVLLERNGSCFVIPKGRPTTVAVSGG